MVLFYHIASAVFIVEILCLLVLVIIVCTMEDLPSVSRNDKICLQNEHDMIECQPAHKRLRTFLDKTIAKKYQQVRQTEQNKLDDYFSEINYRDTVLQDYDATYWEQKPVARICGKTLEERLKDTRKMETIRDWNPQDPHSFLIHGMRYNKGRLVVPVTGTYFVYSFIDLYEPCVRGVGKPNIENVETPIKHGIYKFNILQDKEQAIIVGQQPHKWSLNRYYNSYSSYITSLVELQAGDEIYVQVSNISSIVNADYNYFGAHLV